MDIIENKYLQLKELAHSIKFILLFDTLGLSVNIKAQTCSIYEVNATRFNLDETGTTGDIVRLNFYINEAEENAKVNTGVFEQLTQHTISTRSTITNIPVKQGMNMLKVGLDFTGFTVHQDDYFGIYLNHCIISSDNINDTESGVGGVGSINLRAKDLSIFYWPPQGDRIYKEGAGRYGFNELVFPHPMLQSNILNGNQITIEEVTIDQGVSHFAAGANQTISGIYYDTVKSIYNCDSIVATYIVKGDFIASPAINTYKNDFHIYPIPAREAVYIEYQDKNNNNSLPIKLYDLYGELVLSEISNNKNMAKNNVSGLSIGFCFLIVNRGIEIKTYNTIEEIVFQII